MPNFKPKTNKKIVIDEKSGVTLDSKHRTLQLRFRELEDVTIPSFKAEKAKIIKKLTTENNSIEQKLDMEDRLRDINSEVKKHKAAIK